MIAAGRYERETEKKMTKQVNRMTDDTGFTRVAPGKPPLQFVRNIISKLKFFPKMPDFFCYFEKSSENIVNGTRLLCQMIKQKDERASLLEVLKDYEHIGDHITHDVIDLLHHTFLTPFDRVDIHKLITKMDDILDISFYVGNRMTRYHMTEVPDEVLQLAEITHTASKEIAKAVSYLRHLKNTKQILTHCIEVNRLENEADEIINSMIERLFNDGTDPFQLIKVKEIIENLELATDKCEDVADIIEGIILRNA